MRRILTLLAVSFAFAACSDQPTAPTMDPMAGGVALSVDVTTGATTSETLYAGQDIEVGTVEVDHNGDGTVTIRYIMDSGFCLTETHWDAVSDPSELTNRGGNPQIGQFRYGDDDLACVSSYTETGDISGSGDYYVAAHAVVMGAATGDVPVIYGTLDVSGDGAEEGDIYGINPHDGSTFLIVDISNDAFGDPFSPNGLAIDRTSEMLYYATRQAGADSDLFRIAADGSGSPELVQSGIAGDVFNATVDGDHYYYVPNNTDELWRIPLGGGAPSMYCDLQSDGNTGLYFGDIAADPDNGGIYGVAQVGAGGNVVFFEVDLASCGASGAIFRDPGSYDFLLQVAFGDDGTLYGQKAVSAAGSDAGQWWEIDPATGEFAATLGQSAISFTDIAGGLPVEVTEFDETAWADGDRFTNRGSWATYMGPFTLVVSP